MTPEAAPRTAAVTLLGTLLGHHHRAWLVSRENCVSCNNFPVTYERVRLAIEAEAAAGTALPSGSPEPDGLDVERLARALNQAELDGDFGQGYSPEHAAAAIAELYARLAGEDSK